MGKIEVRVNAEVIRNEIPEMDPRCGALSSFLGVVRNHNHGKKVVAVAYDAFEPLACEILRQIGREAQDRWGQEIGFLIVHRTGRLEVGEASVLIAAQAPHRDEAYQASRYVIEELKKRTPIWKKEYYENGETEWLKGHALCSHPSTGVDHSGGGPVLSNGH